MTHTPTPWHIYDGQQFLEFVSEGDSLVGRVYHETGDKTRHEIRANAELIVRACNRDHHFDALVEALTAAHEHLEYCGYGDDWEAECAREQKLDKQITTVLAAVKQS